jgi:NAD dependent epimerase/dehydratase family enzyme
MGEMAEALLLASTKIEPRVLESTGYTFRAPTLKAAFRQILD